MPMDPYTLLVIARTQTLAKRLKGALDAQEYTIRWASSSSQALTFDLHPSMVVLDLPPSGGARCAARLRRKFDVPLLVLLRSGQSVPEAVDASLPRSCSKRQFAALIQDTLMNHSPHIICAADMCLDTETRRLQLNRMVYQLRPIACRILAILMSQTGQIIARDELFRRVWETHDGDNTRALDVHIAYLRRVLEEDPHHPKLILTERGVGYRLNPPG
jgi:two-component system KDP operon response regulator KdpE